MPSFLFGVESEQGNVIICTDSKRKRYEYIKQTPLSDRRTGAVNATATAETSKLIIESGDSAQSRQNAAMDKEQWNDTRSLRQKVNKRAEKEWDKEDVAFDARDKCQQSANVNAYWEPNTLRCLDRRTGRTVAP